ncbi:hypothetical protein FACS1894113_2850 [Alphaproteobacteria bacterium]|nr:hypothetical protein FACS1894113_2850 [Alphaproteobacteria bacterium]
MLTSAVGVSLLLNCAVVQATQGARIKLATPKSLLTGDIVMEYPTYGNDENTTLLVSEEAINVDEFAEWFKHAKPLQTLLNITDRDEYRNRNLLYNTQRILRLSNTEWQDFRRSLDYFLLRFQKEHGPSAAEDVLSRLGALSLSALKGDLSHLTSCFGEQIQNDLEDGKHCKVISSTYKRIYESGYWFELEKLHSLFDTLIGGDGDRFARGLYMGVLVCIL